MKILFLWFLIFSIQAQSAITYKCSKNGAISYQASPCDENDELKKLNIKTKNQTNQTNQTNSIKDEIGNKTQQIEEDTATKIELINLKYANELEQAKGNSSLLKEIETKKNTEILAAYQVKKMLLEQEIKRLTKLHDREEQAGEDNRKALEDLEKRHKEELREIDRMRR